MYDDSGTDSMGGDTVDPPSRSASPSRCASVPRSSSSVEERDLDGRVLPPHDSPRTESDSHPVRRSSAYGVSANEGAGRVALAFGPNEV